MNQLARRTEGKQARPRVLLLSQYFWPESFRVNDVAVSLRDACADVTVLTGKPNYPSGRTFDGYRACGTLREQYQGIEVVRVPIAPRGARSGVRLALNYLSFVLSASFLGPWLLRGRKFDVVFVYGISPILQGIPAIVFKWIQGAKAVLWVQDLWPDSLSATGYVRNRLALDLVARLVKWIYRHCDLMLVSSRGFLPIVSAMAGGRAVRYHPNPGDLPVPPPQRNALQLGQGFNVVFAGNLGTAQAVDTLVEAAALLAGHPAIRFVLIGDGSRKEWIRDEIARRRLGNIALPGWFPPESMPAILGQASVLLLSLARDEIFAATVPSKLQTYLGVGRPIIAALDGEGARIVREAGAGLACPAGDAPALAAAVRQMEAMSTEEHQAMGRSARQYFEAHFEPGRLARQLLQVFGELMEGRV